MLERLPSEHQPLQHATAQFHLGSVLLERLELREAEAAFTTAAALFGLRGARPEQAKALNGLGATLRAAGRWELAARALEHAATGLAAADLHLEEGAARFNLGLVLRDAGRPAEAVAALARAAELLDRDRAPAQAAAAARELGVTQLELGHLAKAEPALAEAVELADRARDEPGRAAAANALGLTRLASADAARAAEAFATAVAASPRALRPEAFAMAKANLALALERGGRHARARLAARQALAAFGVAAPVTGQAAGVLDRIGATARSDLREVFEQESGEARERLTREELLRTSEVSGAERSEDMRAWIELHTDSALEPVEVAEVWLRGLLELPTDALDLFAHSALAAAAELDQERRETFREAVVRGMVRFHVPQWMRLQELFAQAAADSGQDPASWR